MSRPQATQIIGNDCFVCVFFYTTLSYRYHAGPDLIFSLKCFSIEIFEELNLACSQGRN